MKNKSGKISIISILSVIILIFILVKVFNMYKNNYFSEFYKATTKQECVKFIRDSEEKYSKNIEKR